MANAPRRDAPVLLWLHRELRLDDNAAGRACALAAFATQRRGAGKDRIIAQPRHGGPRRRLPSCGENSRGAEERYQPIIPRP